MDLVEEQGPASGELQGALARVHARVRAGRHAEEGGDGVVLAGEARRVVRDQRAPSAEGRIPLVERRGGELLAHAGLALDQHGEPGPGGHAKVPDDGAGVEPPGHAERRGNPVPRLEGGDVAHDDEQAPPGADHGARRDLDGGLDEAAVHVHAVAAAEVSQVYAPLSEGLDLEVLPREHAVSHAPPTRRASADRDGSFQRSPVVGRDLRRPPGEHHPGHRSARLGARPLERRRRGRAPASALIE